MSKRTANLLAFYGNPFKSGVFHSIFDSGLFVDVFTPLGVVTEEDFQQMDCDYLLNASGLKSMSVLLKALYDGYVVDDSGELVEIYNGEKVTWDRVISALDKQLINGIIYKKFYNKWKNLVATLNVKFDMLSPFSVHLEESNYDYLTSDGGVKRTYDKTDKTTPNTTTTETIKNYKNAFNDNSAQGTPIDNSEDKIINSGSDTYAQSGTVTDDTNYGRKIDRGRNYTRTGNIGNHTNQELINAQREMLKYQIFDTIYSDLDSVLTRSKYN